MGYGEAVDSCAIREVGCGGPAEAYAVAAADDDGSVGGLAIEKGAEGPQGATRALRQHGAIFILKMMILY